MKEIETIKALLAQDRPEPLENLPDIDLYMDQLVSYMPRQSVGGKIPSITPAMINNYVKDGLMPRACGKRYHTEHLICLTAIGLLKNVLTVKDMKLLLSNEIHTGQEDAFYELFLSAIDAAFSETAESLSTDLSEEQLTGEAMRLALTSCAAKTACEQLLSLLRRREEAEVPMTRKEKKESKNKAKEKDSGEE